MAHRNFGSLRELPSGRWQARYRPLHGSAVTLTCDDEYEAREFLSAVRDLVEAGGFTPEQIEALK